MACPGGERLAQPTFFAIIVDVHVNTPLNFTFTVKQWYTLMLEKGVTHTCDDPSAPAVMIASKVEETNLEVDMPAAYMVARMFGVAPEQKTFLFKMLQSVIYHLYKPNLS